MVLHWVHTANTVRLQCPMTSSSSVIGVRNRTPAEMDLGDGYGADNSFGPDSKWCFLSQNLCCSREQQRNVLFFFVSFFL